MASAMIPFTNPHGGIVIGSRRRTLNALMTRFGCNIEEHKAQYELKRPLPYFLVQGPHMKAVNQATIEIYRLLTISLMNGEKKLKTEIEELVNESTHATLSVYEREATIAELETDVQFLTEEGWDHHSGDTTDAQSCQLVPSAEVQAEVPLGLGGCECRCEVGDGGSL